MHPKQLMVALQQFADDSMSFSRGYSDLDDQIQQFGRQAEQQVYQSQVTVNGWQERQIELQAQVDDKLQRQQRLVSIHQDVEDSNLQLDKETQSVIAKAESEHNHWQNTVNKLEIEKQNLEVQLAQLNTQLTAEVSNQTRLSQALQKARNSLEHCVMQNQGKKDHELRDCSSYARDVSSLETQLARCERVINQLRNDIMRLNEKISRLITQINRCYKNIKHCELALNDTHRASSDIANANEKSRQQGRILDDIDKLIQAFRLQLDKMNDLISQSVEQKNQLDAAHEQLISIERESGALLGEIDNQLFLIQRGLNEKSELLKSFDRRLFG